MVEWVDRLIWKWIASNPWGFGAAAIGFSASFTFTMALMGSHKGIEKYFAICGAAFALSGVLTSLRQIARPGYKAFFSERDHVIGGRPFKMTEKDIIAASEANNDRYAELFVGPVLVGVGTLLGGIGGFMG